MNSTDCMVFHYEKKIAQKIYPSLYDGHTREKVNDNYIINNYQDSAAYDIINTIKKHRIVKFTYYLTPSRYLSYYSTYNVWECQHQLKKLGHH